MNTKVLVGGSRAALGALLICLAAKCSGAEPVFSGPQPGEPITPFRVLEVSGPSPGGERDPVTEANGEPVALVFLHALERSFLPLLRVIDIYGASRSNRIRTEVVFLPTDPIEGERRLRAAAGSLKLKARMGMSLDGEEGPGNYGLNKECMMTVVAARGNQVVTNFALIQPGIADAPAVIAGLAATCGDTSPPSVATLTEGMRGGERMREGAPMRERPAARPDPERPRRENP
jgi:hypothetical protein